MRAAYLAATSVLFALAGASLAQPGSPPPTPYRTGTVFASAIPNEPTASPATMSEKDYCPTVVDNGCCSCCGPCFRINAEYLLWWTKSAPLGPPLLTTTTGDPFSATSGGLADPDTVVLIGNSGASYDVFSGLRLTVGADLAGGCALEVSGFLLEKQTNILSFGSNANGVPFLFRPVFNTNTGNPNAGELVALEGVFSGSTTVWTGSRLWGFETNLTGSLGRWGQLSLDGLIGFRYLRLDEDLRISSFSTGVGGASGTIAFNGGVTDTVITDERFGTRNQFYGAQVGLRSATRWDRFDLATTVKVALGAIHQVIDITGTTTGISAGTPTTVNGAVLAVASNIGRFARDDFAVVPELNLQFGYAVNDRLRTYIGYDFLYCSSVVRPGDQINNRVDDRQVPMSPLFVPGFTGNSPPPPFQRADFWAQGINLGIEFRY